MAEGMTLEEQAEVAKGFMEGLIQEFGFQAEVEIRIIDEDTVEVAANGQAAQLDSISHRILSCHLASTPRRL